MSKAAPGSDPGLTDEELRSNPLFDHCSVEKVHSLTVWPDRHGLTYWRCLKAWRLEGGPGWHRSTRHDVSASGIAPYSIEALGKLIASILLPSGSMMNAPK